MAEKKLYSIGEMASICDLNPKTLRYYDQIGLVSPEFKNPETGYRYYTKEQAFTLYIIKKLQLMDFCLQEIKALIEEDDLSKYEREIGRKVDLVNEKMETLKNIQLEGMMLLEKLSHYKGFLHSFNRSDHPSPGVSEDKEDVCLEYVPERTVMATVKTMKNYNNFEISIDRWFEVFNLAEKQRYPIKGSIILTYHADSPMDQFFKPECTLETAIPVEAPHNYPHIKKYGDFSAATTYHYGSYDTIIQSHLKLLRWIEENGYAVDGHVSEEYLVSPFDLQARESYLTKVICPVRKR